MEPVIELRLADIEGHRVKVVCWASGWFPQNTQPFGDIERALMPFELIVIGFPAILDRVDKRNQSSVCPIFWACDISASARPSLPFPSSKGWMLSQYKGPMPARVGAGKGS
ncbi:hypothetical protein JOH50_006017 [Rhizobium leguminosarum]|uniref:hypothetical protein n=1 Tax=Rhizobium leguminosarum TaxID=384 RepID=UPI001EC6B875|nr:hypothetical protein [Rhizobium leguminosarum]